MPKHSVEYNSPWPDIISGQALIQILLSEQSLEYDSLPQPGINLRQPLIQRHVLSWLNMCIPKITWNCQIELCKLYHFGLIFPNSTLTAGSSCLTESIGLFNFLSIAMFYRKQTDTVKMTEAWKPRNGKVKQLNSSTTLNMLNLYLQKFCTKHVYLVQNT